MSKFFESTEVNRNGFDTGILKSFNTHYLDKLAERSNASVDINLKNNTKQKDARLLSDDLDTVKSAIDAAGQSTTTLTVSIVSRNGVDQLPNSGVSQQFLREVLQVDQIVEFYEDPNNASQSIIELATTDNSVEQVVLIIDGDYATLKSTIGSGIADGNGIYSGNGNLTTGSTIATLPAGADFKFVGDFGTVFQVDGDTGKVTIPGLLDPVGLQLTTATSNPGNANTLWANETDSDRPYWGAGSKVAYISETLYGGNGTIGSGRSVALTDSLQFTGNGRYGIDITPSTTYKWQIENTTHDYTARFRHSKDSGGAIVYAQAQANRDTSTGQLIAGLFENIGVAANASAVNVGIWVSAQGASGALNNRAFVLPKNQGQHIIGRTAAIDSTVLASTFGATSDATALAHVVYKDNTQVISAFRNDGWVGVGNFTAPLSAGVQFEVGGDTRYRGGSLYLGTAGPGIQGIRGEAGMQVRFGASVFIENSGAWEWTTGTAVYRFKNSSGNQTILELNGGSPVSTATFVPRLSSVSVDKNHFALELKSTYYDASSLENNAYIRNFAIDTAGDQRLEFNVNGVDKVYMPKNGSVLVAIGDVEVGSADSYYLGDPSTDGSWRIQQSGDDLIFQQREAGVWNTKSTISGA